MKKLILALLTCVMAVPVFAQSMLRVSTTDQLPIKLVIDGRYFKRHGKMLTVGRLPPGNHWVQVYAFDQNDEGRLRNRNLVYEGRIRVHRNEVVNCVVDANSGNAKTYRAPVGTSSYLPEKDDMYGEQPYTTMPVDTGAIAPVNDASIISNEELNKLGKKVSDKLTDTDKMKKMRSGLDGKSISTQQVATMMGWLNFESTRLEFAEWAYNITVDKEHYSQLKSKFSFTSSKQKLDDFLKNK